MDGNVRAVVHAALAYDKEPEDMTLRDAVDWYKSVVHAVNNPNFAEVSYINARWADLCGKMATKQGVPGSYLSYMLNELAVGELQKEDT